jgi:serine/threonine protein kinase
MSSEPERTPEESEPDPELAALLREVARPAPAPKEVAAHVRVAEGAGIDAGVLGQLAGLTGELEPSAGDVLDGRYRIEHELGRGGMGVVYEARNLHTGKRVALKWMSVQAGLAQERVLAMSRRFRREARAAASVRHPNVVDIYDVAGTEGAPFLVMELLEGESLRAWVGRSRARWVEALALLLPVLRGVAAMHRAGVIHRDLKPDNIFLCREPEGEGPLPKVLDFGVAAMQDSADGLGSLTHSGALLGTPSYMAPEQLTGQQVDARTDLYALGVVLYEMLTGELPFARARGAAELAVLQATACPAAPALLSPELRGARADALLKALARDPDHRFQSAEEFAQALAAARPGRLPAWLANRRRIAFVALGLSVALGALAWWRTDEVAPQRTSRAQVVATPARARIESPRAVPEASELTPSPVPPDTSEGFARKLQPPAHPAVEQRVPRSRKSRRNEPAAPDARREKKPTDLSVEDF